MVNRIKSSWESYFSLTIARENWPWRKGFKRLIPRLFIIPVKTTEYKTSRGKKYFLYYCIFRWMWLRIDWTWSTV